MESRFEKKSVLITGCSPGGIGHALAKEFHAKGLHVIATARNKDVLTDLSEMGISTLNFEVTKEENVKEVLQHVKELTGGTLDFLVNNAGRNCTMPALDVDVQDARACFETNFFAIISITQAFIPLLIASKGTIINIGSVAAIIPFVFGSVYNASKAALHSYSDSLRLELEPFGVRVQVIVTGGVQSRIARTERILPHDSLYLPIESNFQDRVKRSQQGAMPNEVFAKGVVREALREGWLKGWFGDWLGGKKKWYWRGNQALAIWFVQNWVGSWLFDYVLPGMFGLRKLKSLVAKRESVKGK